nr:hypothetical protein [uncultured Campylobacter sp.]
MSYFHGIAIDMKKEPVSHTDSPADAGISNDTVYAAVWQFRLKGQGADVFKIKTDDGFYIFEGDEIAGYAPASHDSKEKECLKNISKGVDTLGTYRLSEPILPAGRRGVGYIATDIIVCAVFCITGNFFIGGYIWGLLAFALFAIWNDFFERSDFQKAMKKYEADRAKKIEYDEFIASFERRVASEKIDENTGLITKTEPNK